MKRILVRRTFLLVMTFAVIFLSTLEVRKTLSQRVEPVPTSAEDAPPGVIDLSIDKDLDDIPDQLLAAIERFEKIYAEVSQREGDISEDPEALAILQKATNEYVGSLPFDDSIQEAQKRMAEIYRGLPDAPDDETRQKMIAEMKELDWQMLQDGNYSLVAQILSRRLLGALQAKAPQEKSPSDSKTAASNASEPVESSSSIQHSIEAASILAPSIINAGGPNVDMPTIWSQVTLDPCSSNSLPNYNLQAKGEIMFYQGNQYKNFVYAKKWSHIGIYNGLNAANQPSVYESNASNGTAGAVKITPRSTWSQEIGSCVAFATVTGTNGNQRSSALDSLKAQYGDGVTPYNWNFANKNIDTVLYCSQLVWKMFKNHITPATDRQDLDSNSPTYAVWLVGRYMAVGTTGVASAAVLADLMVAPDEIALHSNVFLYHEGKN